MNAVTELAPASRPSVADLKSVDEWLARAALADPHEACASFVSLLDEIEDSPPDPDTFLQIMERLRRPMLAALEAQDRRYAGRPLPLAPAENRAFMQACDLWLAMLRAWRTLVRTSREADSPLAGSRPLLAARILECSTGLVATHFAAHREVDQTVWHWVHQSYAYTESLRVAEAPVDAGGATCADMYATLLLVTLAHPYRLTQRELHWTWRWARRWAPKVQLWRAAENGGGYAVDLEGCAAPQWTRAGEPGASLRFVECAEVARSVRKRLKKLMDGADPATLGLGRDCTRAAAEELLRALLRSWTDEPAVRRFPRRPLQGTVRLQAGFTNIYEMIAGVPFDAGAKSWQYSRRAADQIHIFHRAIDMESRTVRASTPEVWEGVDESATGFRIRRAASGTRLTHRQLVCVLPQDAPRPLLCEVRWLMEGRTHSLEAGLRALPGLPRACAVRPRPDDPLRPDPWTPAFEIAAAAGSPASLVLPLAWHQPGRELELRDEDTTRLVRLEQLLERGQDYDRVTFAESGAPNG